MYLYLAYFVSYNYILFMNTPFEIFLAEILTGHNNYALADKVRFSSLSVDKCEKISEKDWPNTK